MANKETKEEFRERMIKGLEGIKAKAGEDWAENVGVMLRNKILNQAIKIIKEL